MRISDWSSDVCSSDLSGTLAAYGLGDWYGHSIRSSQLRVLLDKMADKPFTSPTSTGIGIEQFDWNSSLMDVVGLCYAIFPHEKQSLVLVKSVVRGARMAMDRTRVVWGRSG